MTSFLIRVRVRKIKLWGLLMSTTAITLTADGTISNPSLSDGTFHAYRVTQGGSGGYKLTYGNLLKFPWGQDPDLSSVVGQIDVLLFFDDGTNLHFLSIVKDVQTLVEAPSNLTASTNESGQVSFSWTDNSGAEAGFSIQSTTWGEIDTAAANATSKTVAQSPGTDSYVVKAFKIVNGVHYYSRASNVATGTAL